MLKQKISPTAIRLIRKINHYKRICETSIYELYGHILSQDANFFSKRKIFLLRKQSHIYKVMDTIDELYEKNINSRLIKEDGCFYLLDNGIRENSHIFELGLYNYLAYLFRILKELRSDF